MAVDKFGNPISDQYRNIPEEYMQGFRDSQFNKPVIGGMAVTNVTLPSGKKVQFGDTGSAAQFRNYLDSINVIPLPDPSQRIERIESQTPMDPSITPRPGPQPTKTPLTDPSQFAQAQVGAAVRQPTLPQGGAVLPNLALQSVVPNQLQTTPGLQGTVAAATPAATTAPMVQGAAVPSATQVAQTTAPAANTYDYIATTTAGQLPQATAAPVSYTHLTLPTIYSV